MTMAPNPASRPRVVRHRRIAEEAAEALPAEEAVTGAVRTAEAIQSAMRRLDAGGSRWWRSAELAEALGIDRGNASAGLKLLADAGLCEKRDGATIREGARYRLTEQGRKGAR